MSEERPLVIRLSEERLPMHTKSEEEPTWMKERTGGAMARSRIIMSKLAMENWLE